MEDYEPVGGPDDVSGGRRSGPALMVILAIAGWSLEPAAFAAGPGAMQVVERPAHRPVVLRWEARATEAGASFVVLRGEPGRRLIAVGEIRGKIGLEQYRFEDPATILTDTLYELRGVDAEGRQVTLKTVLLRPTFDLRPLEQVQNRIPPPAAVVAVGSPFPTLKPSFRERQARDANRSIAISTVPDPPPWPVQHDPIG